VPTHFGVGPGGGLYQYQQGFRLRPPEAAFDATGREQGEEQS